MPDFITEDYVERNKTKPHKVRCPSCAGNDLSIFPDGTGAHCFECDAYYRIGEQRAARHFDDGKVFDTHAIRELYGQATDYYHSCIGTDQLDFLHSRGIDDNAIALFKIGFCPQSTAPIYHSKTAREAGIADSKGNPFLANRITFPYMADGQITDIRGRSMSYDDPRRYLNPYHRSWKRGADYPFNYDLALQKAIESKTLILTEGEIKAVVADRNGFAVMAFPGMTSYRRGFVPQPGIKIVVIYDNTDRYEDRIRVDRAIFDLTMSIPMFSVVTLPLLGEHKMDIDAFILHDRGGAPRLKHMVDNAAAYGQYKELRKF